MNTFRIRGLYFTSLFLVFTVTLSYTQNAPDFTVTDSQGNEHVLYADYLNQGKTVLIEIFFTTCPPCITLAPYFEDFYQEWGAGEHDVEFFTLSDKSFDHDANINTYKSTYGMTFPGAGVDGGSLQAVEPYKANQFGQFTGTPTFIVIAPDGSVTFDVFGSGITGQYDALDEALLATGAVKPTEDTMVVVEPVVFSGAVRKSDDQATMSGVIVDIFASAMPESPILQSDTTDSNGQIEFSFLPDEIPANAVVRARKNGLVTNGMTALDLLAIQKHLLNITPFTTGAQLLASDANGSNSLSALDLLVFQKLILSIETEFPDGVNWYFIPEHIELEFGNGQPPTNFIDFILFDDIVAGNTTLVFKGIKRGDLNGSADPNE